MQEHKPSLTFKIHENKVWSQKWNRNRNIPQYSLIQRILCTDVLDSTAVFFIVIIIVIIIIVTIIIIVIIILIVIIIILTF